MNLQPDFDQIGYWSEVKLEIVKEYASPIPRFLLLNEVHPFITFTLMRSRVRVYTRRNWRKPLCRAVRLMLFGYVLRLESIT